MKNTLNSIFINTKGQLRNGWWMAIFIGLVALTRPIYKPVKSFLEEMGAHSYLLELLSPFLILLVTYICLRLRRENWRSVGLGIDLSWFRHFAVGLFASALMICTLVGIIFVGGGAMFSVNPQFEPSILLTSFYLFLVGAALEELLHRGFLFQRLIDGVGFWPAQFLVATLFAIGHWSNPGMDGSGQIIGSADLFIGSLLFGLAYYKTQSLALPIGLHLGWNWCMGSVFGFNVSGHQSNGLLTPALTDMPTWFTGGEFGLEGSVISVLIGCIALAILWYWTGSKAAQTKLAASFS